MDALIGTFHIDTKLIIAQVINFAIVFVVLYKFAIKPLGKLMAERSQTIQKGLDDAKANESLLLDTKKAYDDELARARKDAQALMSEMKATIEEKRVELVAQAEKESAQIVLAGKQRLEDEKNQMLKSVEKELGMLVIKTTEKVLGKEISEKINKDIIKEQMNHVK